MSEDGSSALDDHLRELTGRSMPKVCFIPTASGDPSLNDGLGFLPGSACPHYRGEPGRRDLYHGWISSGDLPDGYAVDDHAALIFRDGQFVEAISEQPDRPVYRVER